MVEKYDPDNELYMRMPEKWHPDDLRGELNEQDLKAVDVIVKILTDEAYFGNHETLLKLIKWDLSGHARALEIEYERNTEDDRGPYGRTFA